jgi:hypothetical protein
VFLIIPVEDRTVFDLLRWNKFNCDILDLSKNAVSTAMVAW